MPTYTSPVNPLANIYTVGMVAKTIELWLNEENLQKLDHEFLKSLVQLSRFKCRRNHIERRRG